MDRIADFDINVALKQYLDDPAKVDCPEADARLVDTESDSELLSNSLVNSVLNPIIDAVTENPEALTRAACFDSVQFLLKYVAQPAQLF
jgi:condensin complex subunit 1